MENARAPWAAFVVTVATLAAGPSAAEPWRSGHGVEVGATSVAEGRDDSDGMEAAGGLRAAGEVRNVRVKDHPDDPDKVQVVGVGAGATGTLSSEGGGAMLRGSAWLESLREDHRRDGDELSPYNWLSLGVRLDYRVRVPLGRRRDLATTSLTGAAVHFEGMGLVYPSESGGNGFLFMVDELEAFDTPLGAWGSAHGSVGLWRHWDDADGDGLATTHDVLAIDATVADSIAVDSPRRGALITRFVPYAERERRLPGGLRADVRVAYTWTCACETEDQPPLRHVSAWILDGALRRDLGAATLGLRYHRDLYPTVDGLVALEDRVDARAAWAADTWSLAAGAYAARTTFRNSAGPPMSPTRDRSDGIELRATVARRAWILDAALEGGHSYYAASLDEGGAASPTPVLGWRATVDLSWRLGSIVVAPGHTPH